LSGFADDNMVIQVVKAYYGVLLNEEAAASGLSFTLPDPLQQHYTCPVRVCVCAVVRVRVRFG
jgi:hypothetical protein